MTQLAVVNRHRSLLRAVLRFVVILCCVLFASAGWADGLKERIRRIEATYSVKVHHNLSDRQILPKKYLKAPYYARCGAIADRELPHALGVIEKFLRAYPRNLIRKNLTAVALCRDLGFYNLNEYYSGAVLKRQKMILVEYFGHPMEMDDTLHHEFSSLLLKKYMHLFPRSKWHKNSGRYTNTPYRSVHGDVWRSNAGLREQGFLHAISKNNFEDDFNVFASAYFVQPKRLWRIVRKYPRLRKKYEIVKSFYKTLARLTR